MIRIRKPDGSVTEVPGGCFVEVSDNEGNVAEVTFVGSNYELKRIAHNSGNTARDYAKLYGVNFIDQVVRI